MCIRDRDWEILEKTSLKLLISQIDLNDPADIWTIDGSLNTLSDRPGMDSQKTNTYGVKVFHQFDAFEFQEEKISLAICSRVARLRSRFGPNSDV